jgi:transposase
VVDINQIQQLYQKYQSIKQVSMELGISRNTVRKYIRSIILAQNGDIDEIRSEMRVINRPRSTVSDELIQIVHSYLTENITKPRKQRLSAAEIHRLVQSRGFQVGYTSIKDIIHDWKESHRSREIYILQDPLKGYRAEFDWGYVDLTIDNIVRKVSLAVFTLNYSQYRFGKLFLNQTTFDVIQAHIDFFSDIQAIPQVMVYDNATTIYNLRNHQYNERFLLCATHYNFKPQVRNPGSPHEKGSTEKSVAVIRKAAFSDKTRYSTIAEANDHLHTCLKGLNNQKVHRRTSVPNQLLEEERVEMNILPSLEFSNYELRMVKINRYNLVQVLNNYYSVPDTFCAKVILVKIYAERIEMMNDDTVIAVHVRKIGHGEYSLHIDHYLKTLKRKPGAIRHSKLLRTLDEKIQQLFEMHYVDCPKEFLPILEIIRDSSPEAVIYALEVSQDRDLFVTPELLKLLILSLNHV